VALPAVAKARNSARNPPPSVVRGIPRSRYRVLLVEDNPVDAMRIRQLLARARTATFEVESIATLGLAQERACAGGIDVVLLDLDLPDSLGLTTYASFACVAPHLPVVVLTRATDEALAFDAVQQGAQDLLFKTQLSAESLARAIRCAIERHRLVTSLRGLSLTDELTGLLNRRGFATIAQGHLRLASRTGHRFLLFFADLDHLKQINDRHGHHAGDDALVRVADVLRRTFRQSDVVARYGGDEFAILALDTSADEGATIRRRLGRALAEANEGEGRPVGLSVGTIALDGRLEEPLGALLARADQALYREKAHRAAAGPAGRAATAVRNQ
jgi:diguanylate cyclase (GGDEF)-like protein